MRIPLKYIGDSESSAGEKFINVGSYIKKEERISDEQTDFIT